MRRLLALLIVLALLWPPVAAGSIFGGGERAQAAPNFTQTGRNSAAANTGEMKALFVLRVFVPAVFNKMSSLLLYGANFSTQAGWEPLSLGSGGSAGVLAGAYFLRQTQPNYFSASLAPFAAAGLPDSGYEVLAQLNRVGSGDPSFGLVFDWKSASNFFLFQIDSDSQIFYIARNGVVLANFLPSSQIRTGTQTNELRVVRRQSAVDFYINGSLVLQNAAAPDLAAPGEKGRLGLQLATYATPAEIQCSSFSIRRLP